MTNQKPRGGTELQLEYLHKYVDKFTLDKVQITTSIPEKDPQQPGKPQILWQKNSYDQPNLAPWFSDKRVTIVNTTGMFLILTGTLKSLHRSLVYLQKNVS